MHEQKKSTRTVFGVIAASVLVVAAIALPALFGGDMRRGGGIVLPTQGQSTSSPEEDLSGAGFVTLTTENVPEVVRTLERPACYHQSLTASVPSEEDASGTQIDLWVENNVWKIVRRDPVGTRCILTDGRLAYVWYTDDVRAMNSLRLPDGVTRDELAGVVTYETIASAEPGSIREASYAPVSSDPELYCIAVKTQDGIESALYQIDPATGLLFSAELQRDGKTTYVLQQTALELLSQDDAALREEMRLPVGTPEFSAEGETRQG